MDKKPIKELIILNPGAGLGDHLMCLPMAALLKRLMPGASVTLASSANSRSINDLTDAFDDWLPIPQGGSLRKLIGLVKIFKRLAQSEAVFYIGKSLFVPLLYFFLTGKKMVAYGKPLFAKLFLQAYITRDNQGYLPEQHAKLAASYFSETVWEGLAAISPVPSLKGLRLPNSAVVELSGALDQDTRLKIMLHPGVSRLSQAKGYLKAWPAAKWAGLIRALSENNPDCRLYLLGGPEDKEIVAEVLRHLQGKPLPDQLVNCADKTSNLLQLAYLLSQADIAVTVDSFPMHLGIALGIPTVAIFASTNESVFAPVSDSVRVVTRPGLTCRPCLWLYRDKACEQPICLEVPVESVLRSLYSLMADMRAVS